MKLIILVIIHCDTLFVCQNVCSTSFFDYIRLYIVIVSAILVEYVLIEVIRYTIFVGQKTSVMKKGCSFTFKLTVPLLLVYVN